MWIDAAWSQRGLAALHAMLDVDDHTRKAMIQFLFDEGFWDQHKLTWDAACARWNDCKNPSKPAFFKVGELWALAWRFERHQLFLSMADNLSYEVRRRPTPERQQQLLERMAGAVERCEQQLATARTELARLNLAAAPRALAPVREQGQPRFKLADDDADADAAPGGF
jgi:hypothetical protein